MDYNYIESLVISAKEGDNLSKELLVEEFKPYILNISKTTYIYGYDIFDIQNECYRILFKCLNLYNPEKHRFVAYAIVGIKQSLNNLIRKDNYRSKFEGRKVFSLLDDEKDSLVCDELNPEEALCEASYYEYLAKIVDTLNKEERELISFIFYKGNTVKNYAKLKDMCYTTAILKRKNVLNKIYTHLSRASI
ncbi:MAG: sigma-70 family RNA polymerase sigma factor [Clostridium butyricum]|nr:sigma-70 family RNA polymerase sigma factor [Clostridium butyricum]